MLKIKELEGNNERSLIQDERDLSNRELIKIAGGDHRTEIGCQFDQVNPDGNGTTYISYQPDDIYTPTVVIPWIWTKQDLGDNPQNPSTPTPCSE